MSAPLLVETVGEGEDSFVQRWMCEPPAIGVRYTVLRQEWDDDWSVRTIYDIDIMPESATEAS